MNFTDTKVLLSNYPNIRKELSLVEVGGNGRIEIQSGYDIQVDAHQITVQIACDLITAILSYDNVYIEGNHIWDVLQVFGSKNLSELLRAEILHFIPDNKIYPVMMMKSDKVWRPNFLSYSVDVVNEKDEIVFEPIQDEWSELEITLYHKKIGGKDVQAFLYLIDEKKKVINQDRIIELTLKETRNDLKNERFVIDIAY